MFVRSVGSVPKSGPVRSTVSDRSRTDLGPDRFEDFLRRRENFDDDQIFEKQARNGAIDFVQESSTSEIFSRFLSRLMFENSLGPFGRIQPIVLRFIALYPLQWHKSTDDRPNSPKSGVSIFEILVFFDRVLERLQYLDAMM